eukprot:14513885-Alexandrium_andersonii.AAC.1
MWPSPIITDQFASGQEMHQSSDPHSSDPQSTGSLAVGGRESNSKEEGRGSTRDRQERQEGVNSELSLIHI